MMLYRLFLKRLLDIIISLVAIFVLLPLLLIISLLIRKNLGTPIIFSQERPGKNGEIFKLYKFRSMTDERNELGELLPDHKRLTTFGKNLRSSSLDELPELWNILIGDMSFVGPRPLLVQYLPLYNKEQSRRHEVRPGLTGYAQVNGRNNLNWVERFKLDVQYIDEYNIIMDLKIIFQTFKKVLLKEDINSSSTQTMEPFKGNLNE